MLYLAQGPGIIPRSTCISLTGWWSTGTGCPGRLWILLLWRYSSPAWIRSCAACCRWPCFGRGVGLGDPQRSLPTANILWFCDLRDKYNCKTMAERKGICNAPQLLGCSAKSMSLKVRGQYLVRKRLHWTRQQAPPKAMGLWSAWVPQDSQTWLGSAQICCGWDPLERTLVTGQALFLASNREELQVQT